MPKHSSAAQRLYRIIIIFGTCVVLPVNVAGWIAYRSIVGSLEDEFSRRMETIAASNAEIVGPFIPLDTDDTSIRLALKQDFQTDINTYNLERLFILSNDLTPQISVGAVHSEQEFQRMISRDHTVMVRALGGEYTHGRRERRRGIDIMRAYAPIWTGLESGKLASGVLGVEAAADFYQTTDRVRQGLALFGIASVILTLLAIAFAGRLLRRTVAIEEAMERTTRAMALGRMTSTVAHEIRNPLGIISTNAQVLIKSEEPKTREIAEDILAQIHRSDRIIRRFLNLSDSAESRKTVLLNDIVNYSAEAVRKGIDPQFIALILDVRLDGARIDCDPDRLHSVFVNILDNAVDAIRGSSGKGSIQLQGVLIGNEAEITITDTGPGMDAETLEHVKEPFYTKKATGTGLGLAIADRIVREHGGQLNIKSTPGKGTTITLRLPVKAADVDSARE